MPSFSLQLWRGNKRGKEREESAGVEPMTEFVEGCNGNWQLELRDEIKEDRKEVNPLPRSNIFSRICI